MAKSTCENTSKREYFQVKETARSAAVDADKRSDIRRVQVSDGGEGI